jgi:hypothetical protein
MQNALSLWQKPRAAEDIAETILSELGLNSAPVKRRSAARAVAPESADVSPATLAPAIQEEITV